MNLDRIIAVIIRIYAVNVLFTAMIYITYLPDRFAYLEQLRANRHATHAYELEIQGMFLRIILNVVLGTLMFVGWRKFARFFSKDIAVEPTDRS